MSKIHILPEILINKIAAGEVIERPSSIVKELVENAIDADAKRIDIAIEGGGVKLINVSDNGCGMDRDDLLLALQSHATSKIRSEEDLYNIGTLGFRGEALPSIASVSKLVIKSRQENSDCGYCVSAVGGKYTGIKPEGCHKGTIVEVSDLFFNTPARRKFLKLEATENRHNLHVISDLSIAHPEISFSILCEGRKTMELQAADCIKMRVSLLFEIFRINEWLDISLNSNIVNISGFISPPSIHFANRDAIRLYLSGRPIYDRTLLQGVLSAYEHVIPSGRFPGAFIFLSVPYSDVDINVHPSKREVRFKKISEIRALTNQIIKESLGGKREVINYLPASRGEAGKHAASVSVSSIAEERTHSDTYLTNVPGKQFMEMASIFSEIKHPHLMVIGQWRGSFILAEGDDGLFIIDQHVAHERLRYESFIKYMKEMGPVQRLLIPNIFKIPPEINIYIQGIIDSLRSAGFHAELFGNSEIVVRAIPFYFPIGDLERFLRDMFASYDKVNPMRALEDALISRSCKGAVKAGDNLSINEMQSLVDDLLSCEVPFSCPHGRPIVVKIAQAEVIRLFGRASL